MGIGETMGDETPAAASAASAGVSEEPKRNARRVLILEDDEELKGLIAEYLYDFGYDVTRVSNGVDGVRELAKRDYDAVICDMMMPKLPGDMFYLAVQRMRPRLCDRFLFVTGHKHDPKIGEFIARIGGTILNKPFRMETLLDMLAYVQVRALSLPG
jgi:DNA-binding response OmpR family regulator